MGLGRHHDDLMSKLFHSEIDEEHWEFVVPRVRFALRTFFRTNGIDRFTFNNDMVGNEKVKAAKANRVPLEEDGVYNFCR